MRAHSLTGSRRDLAISSRRLAVTRLEAVRGVVFGARLLSENVFNC